MPHTHHHWLIAALAFILSLLCAAYAVYDYRKDNHK